MAEWRPSRGVDESTPLPTGKVEVLTGRPAISRRSALMFGRTPEMTWATVAGVRLGSKFTAQLRGSMEEQTAVGVLVPESPCT